MPVAGVPLIQRILAWLADQDVRDIVVNLHHLPATITRLAGDGSGSGVRVRYSWEPELLGSAGGPRHALPLLEDRFFVVNGDTMTHVRLDALDAHHTRTGALVTLAVVPNPDPQWYGGVLADAEGWVTGFCARGEARPNWHFVGVQMAQADAFFDLPDGEPAASIPDLYGRLIARRPRSVAVHAGSTAFHDIGTAADYLRTSLAIAEAEGLEPLPAGRGVSHDATALVDRTILWDDVTIGPSAALVECIVGDGVRIPAGARFERRAIVRAAGRRPGAREEIVGDLLVAPIDEPDRIHI